MIRFSILRFFNKLCTFSKGFFCVCVCVNIKYIKIVKNTCNINELRPKLHYGNFYTFKYRNNR